MDASLAVGLAPGARGKAGTAAGGALPDAARRAQDQQPAAGDLGSSWCGGQPPQHAHQHWHAAQQPQWHVQHQQHQQQAAPQWYQQQHEQQQQPAGPEWHPHQQQPHHHHHHHHQQQQQPLQHQSQHAWGQQPVCQQQQAFLQQQQQQAETQQQEPFLGSRLQPPPAAERGRAPHAGAGADAGPAGKEAACSSAPVQDVGWFRKCRGCGCMTAYEISALSAAIPFCMRCQARCKELVARREDGDLWQSLLHVHTAWEAAGV